MRFFKPTPYVEYLPPKLTEGKEWYVHYSVINPATGKMVRYRNKVNRPKTVKERRQIAKLMIASISEKLALGWNPILEKEAPKSYHTLIEAMDTFLKVKTKETEENSLRSYKSYIKILKNWLTENNYPQDLYVAQFNEPAALGREDLCHRICLRRPDPTWLLKLDHHGRSTPIRRSRCLGPVPL